MTKFADKLAKILALPEIQATLAYIAETEPKTIEQQIALAQTPAPPFGEKTRADFYLNLIKEAGLEMVGQDEIDNTYGYYSDAGEKTLLVTGHIDSVFSIDTDVTVRQENGIYYGPGIFDDARGLAAVLSVVRALKHSGVKLGGKLLIGGNVGEESQGDLRGIKKIFKDHPEIDGFLSVDNASPSDVVFGGTGSRRYEITFTGSGGHSFGNFGRPSAIHAAGRAIGKIATLDVPKNPKTTFNVGVIQGGTLPTAIAEFCLIRVDIRSNSAAELKKYDDHILGLIKEAVVEESARAENPEHQLKLEITCIGDRPAGMQEADCDIVQATSAVITGLGLPVNLIGASSTDSNVPISLGVPAATVGGGGKAGNAHSLGEWFDPTNSHQGPQLVFLLICLLLGVEGVTEGIL